MYECQVQEWEVKWAWLRPGQTGEMICLSLLSRLTVSRERLSGAKTYHAVPALSAAAAASSEYFLPVITWWSETTETWPAPSRSLTLVCCAIGNRSWHGVNEELFMAQAVRLYPLGVSGPPGNRGRESAANAPAAICGANICSRQRKAGTTQGPCATWLCYMAQAKL